MSPNTCSPCPRSKHAVGERVGPIAKQWEGEVVGVPKTSRRNGRKESRHLSLPAQARVPSLSPRV